VWTTPRLRPEDVDFLRNQDVGLCLACGRIQLGAGKPNARGEGCGSCGENQVYGIQECLRRDWIDIDPDAPPFSY
jgi:hypothetical protein